MRHSAVPALLLAAGLILAPATAVQAAPCDGKVSCLPTEGAQNPLPTQPSLAPEPDQKPAPKPTRTREQQAPPVPEAPAPAAPEPAKEQPVPERQAPPQQAPAQPKVAEEPAPDVVAPEPATESTPADPTRSATPSASSTSTASPQPSASSNWNTPVDKGRETQAAAMVPSSFNGPNLMGLFGILGGVLLVGLGGLAFALWSKNRLSSH
ncbi:hypothetical protein [Paenarthrobacter ilicis]|uniref:Outer membrane biosynthesis protein TonB n=1 Tax=Paenarthrobacter ilicis TaxID=43665 RepID=A0ABX0THQ1_9MICC|nr:hypothetical protein [Paenarthrobacter ilicis]MBM7792650.1 outer membrane biosynthesis protein TonB [Paenarthrobacter ilicis]NIJ00993.1 outer membrane biosynthesis protein TonB [Paenarthrobacter ilicis]